MSDEQRARRAGSEARRAGEGFEPPDLVQTLRRRRMARVAGGFVFAAIVVLVGVGASALVFRNADGSAPTATTNTVTTTPPPSTGDSPVTTTTRPQPTTTSQPAPRLPDQATHGGTARVATSSDLLFGYTDIDGSFVSPTMNPLFQPTFVADLARLTVPGVFRLDATTGMVVPWAVERIPRPGNGGVTVGDTITVTYEVRSEAVWADGTPMAADDLVFTHELIMNEGLPIDPELRRIHSLVVPGSITAEGKRLSLQLTKPDISYELLFEYIVPAHAVDPSTFADDWNTALWLSGGPFVFDSYEPSSSSSVEPGIIQFSRNENYWEVDPLTGARLPYLDGIELQAFVPGTTDGVTLATWFTTESTDLMLSHLIDRWSLPSLGDPVTEGFELTESWDTLYEVLAFQLADTRFDVNPDSLNGELLYRKAVLAAIDRVALGLDVDAPALSSILGTSSPTRDHDAWDQYDLPGDVGRLLQELSTELGLNLADQPATAVYSSSSADTTILIGEAVAAQLSAAGIETSTDFSGDFFVSKWPEGRTDLFAFRLFTGIGIGRLVGALDVYDPSLPEGDRLLDWSSLGEPAERYSAIMAEARTILEPERVAELLQEAETILADNAVVYPLVRRQVSYHPYWPQQIQGFVPNPHPGWDTATAALWWSPNGATS